MFEMRGEALKLLLLFLLLIIAAVSDWKTKSIPVWLPVAAVLTGIAVCLMEKRDLLSVLPAAVPGLFLFLLSRGTAGEVGIGDAWMTLALSLFLNWQELFLLLTAALFLAALVSLGILASAVFRGSSARKRTIPFLCVYPVAALMILFGGMV